MPEPTKAAQSETETPAERLLSSLLELEQDPHSKTAHHFRTSVRRFQAWFDVFHPETNRSQKRVLKALEKVRKTAGKLRDTEVHLDLLKHLPGKASGENKEVQKALKLKRNAFETKLRRLLHSIPLDEITSTLRAFEKVPKESGETSAFHQIQGMTTLSLDEYRAFVQRHGKVTSENLHDYRLACKRFRYTAELAGESAEAASMIETWKGVQDAIGEWHDYLTLAEVADDVLGKSALRKKLRQLTDEKYEAARAVVERAELKLIREAPPKKNPRSANSSRNRRAA